jgi:hypothetical protein
MDTALWLILFLFTKHFIVDFPLQNKFQWSNKGTYGHPGGILHSGLHGLATYFCIAWYAPVAAIYLAFADMFIHYHIDWAKMNINAKLGWAPTTHEQFWWLLGLDQFLHALTYIGLVALVTT